jgi:hypothetical protein
MQTYHAFEIGGKRVPLVRTRAGHMQWLIQVSMSFVILEDMSEEWAKDRE